MSEQDKKDQMLEKRSSRRSFIKNSGLTVGGVVLGGALGSLLVDEPKSTKSANHSDTPATKYDQALMYFDRNQFETVEAAAEQIYPKTEVGPGAKELLAAYYIDHQLAGSFGLNSKEYMTGPFYPGEAVPEQGYQTHLNRQQVFNIGIGALNDEAAKTSDEKPKFAQLSEEQQIEILKAFEADEVKLNGAVSASFFFNLLRKMTIEGVYADPMYGGNKDMAGWKMKNFPGHQPGYLNTLEKDEFVKIAPKSLNSQHQH